MCQRTYSAVAVLIVELHTSVRPEHYSFNFHCHSFGMHIVLFAQMLVDNLVLYIFFVCMCFCFNFVQIYENKNKVERKQFGENRFNPYYKFKTAKMSWHTTIDVVQRMYYHLWYFEMTKCI